MQLKILGGDFNDLKWPRNVGFGQLGKFEQVGEVLTKHGYFKGKVGGGGRSRTYDAADMSRVL